MQFSIYCSSFWLPLSVYLSTCSEYVGMVFSSVRSALIYRRFGDNFGRYILCFGIFFFSHSTCKTFKNIYLAMDLHVLTPRININAHFFLFDTNVAINFYQLGNRFQPHCSKHCVVILHVFSLSNFEAHVNSIFNGV